MPAVGGRRVDLRLVGQEEGADLGVHQRRDLIHDHRADLAEVALALQQAADTGQVRVEPALLCVGLGRGAQRRDHLVDRVLEVRDLAAGRHRDLRGQAPAAAGVDTRDPAQLRRQSRRA